MSKKDLNQNDEMMELVYSIVETAKHFNNEITYEEISNCLSDQNLDKDALEELYDLVESKGINIIESREPNGIELEADDIDIELDDDIELDENFDEMSIEDDFIDEEVEGKKTGVVIKASGEIEVSDSGSKAIPTDDPVRMYFKEIGKVPLLYSRRRKRACY